MELTREEPEFQQKPVELQFIESEHKIVKFQKKSAIKELKRDLAHVLITLMLILFFSYFFINYSNLLYGYDIPFLAYLILFIFFTNRAVTCFTFQ